MATRGGFLLRRAPNFLLYRPKFAARSFAAAAGHSEPPRRNATRTAVGHDSAIVAGWPASVETAITPQSSALAGKPLRDLVRGWFVFKMLSYDWVVRHCLTLYSVSKRVLGQGVTRRLLRASVAGQFLGGFSEQEARGVAQLSASNKICTIWNFSTEQELGEEMVDWSQQEARFDEVSNKYLESISMSAKHNYLESPVKFAAIKLTAIVAPHILLKLSQMLDAVKVSAFNQVAEDDNTERRAEVAKCMSRFSDLSLLEEAGQSQGLPQFTSTEREQVARLINRLDQIGECAVREGVRVLVDAEESRMQPAIHHLAVHYMMPRFNLSHPVIYNTVQMYLKSSLDALLTDITAANNGGFSYGIKLVRGAYMHYERDILEETGKEYPVHDSKGATDDNYNRGVRHLLQEVAHGSHTAGVGGVLIGTHNRHSVEAALHTMQELGIPGHTGTVCFGQQLGMADYIAYTLVDRGCFIHKFMAYGEERDVVPFLVRRAQENNSVSETARLERELYGEELMRRLSRRQ